MPLADPDGQSFQAFPPLCLLSLQLSQSLGNAGTCAEGPDGYRQSPLHQDASIWPKTTDLAGTGSKGEKTWCFCCVFLSLQFFINSQARSVRRRARHCQMHRHRNTQTEQRDCLLSLCYCDRSVILWGGVQSKQNTTSFKTLHSTAHCARLLFAHKVRYEVKLVLSQEELGQLLNAIQPKLQHQ